jgi:hypothetical protein
MIRHVAELVGNYIFTAVVRLHPSDTEEATDALSRAR